jgi:hypothetical protein
MPVPAKNALLKAPRPVRTFLQHFYVVVGFENEHMSGAHPLEYQFGGVAEIGQKPDIPLSGAEQKTNGILRVVGNAERIDSDIADFKAAASAEQSPIALKPKLILESFLGWAVAIDRDSKFRAESRQALDVIGMFVGDKDAAQVLGDPADGGQSFPNLTQAESGIDEDASFTSFQKGAVTGGTAAKNRQTHGHAQTLLVAQKTGNDFSNRI